MKRPDKRWYILYALVSLADILCLNLSTDLRFITKPLLMPVLLIAYRSQTISSDRFSRMLQWALFLSWLGDLALLASGHAAFIAGLSCFLAAHIVYISYFRGIRSNRTSFLKRRPVMLLAVIVFVFELLHILWPGLGSLAVPVTVYATIIGTMLAYALWQYGKLSERTAWLFIVGAFSFVLSDSMLAIARFRFPFPQSGTLVMSTYCLAQFLIARGSAMHLKEQAEQAAADRSA